MHPLEPFKYCPKCGSSQFLENNFKSKKCHTCGFVYYYNVSSSVAVIIRNVRGEILVATRAHEPAKGTFDLPGGFIDMDETAEEAVAREIMEETGMTVIETKYKPWICFLNAK
jgi:NADH pyrophosphatase NudC (nudix superfamily)